MQTKHPIFFVSVLGVVLANYLAQVPYYRDRNSPPQAAGFSPWR